MATKVKKAALELGYRPNTLARAMITGQSRIIGLVVTYLDNQFYPLAVEYLNRALQARGYHVLLFTIGNDDDVAPIVEELLAYQVEGIVTASVQISSDLGALCDAAGIPVVMFNRGQDEGSHSQVTSDNVEGGRTVARFLVAAGYRRIAHISGWQKSSTGRDRALGFAEGLAEKGLEPTVVVDGRYHRETSAAWTREIFGPTDRPEAVFVGNDHMAFAVMDTLRFELGLSVPGDVGVVGYDDVPIASWAAYDLTTIRQPVNQMVQATVETLLSRIEDNTEPRRILIPGPLKIRGSCKKPKGFNT
jgi:DNA-binding LacI/PurR family transcriptional regulator